MGEAPPEKRDTVEQNKMEPDHREAQEVINEKRPFACSMCNERFTKKGHCRRHEEEQHGDRGRSFKCSHCSQKFLNHRYLRNHVAKMHAVVNGVKAGQSLPKPGQSLLKPGQSLLKTGQSLLTKPSTSTAQTTDERSKRILGPNTHKSKGREWRADSNVGEKNERYRRLVERNQVRLHF